MDLRRRAIAVGLLALAFLAGAVFFSGRGALVFGAQGDEVVARPKALLQVDLPTFGTIEKSTPPTAELIAIELKTQIGLIRSRTNLSRVLADHEVASLASVKRHKDPLAWLERGLQIENVDGSRLLRVELDAEIHAPPQEQALLINKVVNGFLRMIQVEHNESLLSRQEWLENEIKQRSRGIEELRLKIDDLQEEIRNLIEEPRVRESLASYTRELRAKRFDLSLEKASTEVLLTRRQAKADRNPTRLDEISHLEDRLADLSSRENVVNTELMKINKFNTIRSGDLEKLDILKHDLSGEIEVLEKLKEQMRSLRWEALRKEPRIKLIDPATAP